MSQTLMNLQNEQHTHKNMHTAGGSAPGARLEWLSLAGILAETRRDLGSFITMLSTVHMRHSQPH
jgi:hypothetical protein